MDTHRFNLVIPQDMWEQIRALAERNRRSITAEILRAIELHLECSNQVSHVPVWIPKRDAEEDDELLQALLVRLLREQQERDAE